MSEPAEPVSPTDTAPLPADGATPPRSWRDRVRRGLRRHEEEREVEGEPASPAAGQLLAGRYRLGRELGRGGMGAVYEAEDTRLGRRVAIKLLLLERRSPQALERFQVEARAAARLRHPHIVGLLEVGEEGERQYQVMELVEGESLAARLRREGPLPPREVARIGAELADALGCAHTHGILHRDVKPANVLLDGQGRALLSDFGLAKEVERAGTGPTETGQVMGTPAYMSPEQVRGELWRVDRRADVYALGATLFELLTGTVPFVAPSVPAVLRQILDKEPPLAGQLRAGVDRDLETICLRCLEKEPERRYGSAAELGEDLRRWLRDEPILARRPGAGERLTKWLRRNRAVARALGASAALALVVIAGGAAMFLQRLRRERDRAAAAAREARESLELLVREVKDELAEVPGERVRGARQRLLGRAVERLTRLQKHEPGAGLEVAEAWRQIAELALEAGDTTGAEQAARRALLVARPFAQARPEDVRAQRSLMASLHAVARVAGARGDGLGALPLAEEALELARRVDRELTDSLSGEQLATCLAELAVHQERLGRLEPAGLALEEALRLRRALCAAGSSPERLRALGQSLERLGKLREEQGDRAAGLALLEECLRLDRQLLAQEPENVQLLRGLTTTLVRLGHTRADGGDLEAASALQEEALGLARRLATLDPAGLQARRHLAASLLAVGNLREKRGELQGALELYQEAIASFRQLRDLDPADPTSLDHLASALGWSCSLLEAQGDARGALAAGEEAVELRRAHVRQVGPEHVDARQGLAMSLIDLGDLVRDPNRARALIEEGVALLRELVARVPEARENQLQLARSLNRLGALLKSAGEPAAARAPLHEEALSLARQAVAREPGSVKARRFVAHALIYLGELASDPAAAEARFQEALALQREVLALDEQNATERRNLAVTLARLADLHKQRGAEQAALPCYEEAAAHHRLLAGRDPTNKGARRDLRTSLSELADARRRAGDQAGASQAYEEVVALAEGDEEGAPPREQLMALVTAAHDAFQREQVRESGRIYAQALDLARLRQAAAPEDLGARRDLSLILLRVSDVHRNLGALEDGLAAIQSAVQVHRPLVDADAHRYQKEHGTLLELLEEAQRDLALAKGEVQPRDTEEALGTAYLLCQRGEHARAIPLYRTVLSVPAVRADLEVAHLYNAAAAASCAAERTEDPAAREALLREGLGWLEEDLRRRRERLSALEAEAASPARDARLEAFRADLRRHLARAREGDPDLAALRGAPGFAELVR